MDFKNLPFLRYNTIIVGSGAAGLNAALRLHEMGQREIAIVTEGINRGTSRNTGSDKQTYYKLSLGGRKMDSVLSMAQTLFDGGCVDGDIAFAEAAGSVRSFFHLVELGVPFPTNDSGEYIGYKTDHDPMERGTSAGPYTSKYMTMALKERCLDLQIAIYDKHLAVKLLTAEDGDGKRVTGLVALNQAQLDCAEKRFTLFSATNVIWATGGEAGMYQRSVYPYAQNGGSGLLFDAGATGKNLTESQYGIASVKFRWNLSGSFQQCLPRYLSVDADGGDEREFLLDVFSTPEQMINAVFLKGYQWPFDPLKIAGEGSSLIDILIYQEEMLKNRHVYMDFIHNSKALEPNGCVDFSGLSEEARQYLVNCNALQQTPYERLAKINPAAITVYRDHGIDLAQERLEISVCAQHNNGGIAGNAWWESEIRHLFPVGEVNGSHGVYRPGGSALNAGQVGGLRAAQYITRHYREEARQRPEFLAEHASDIEQVIRFADEAVATPGNAPIDVRQELELLRARMSRYGSFIRTLEGIRTALQENRDQRRFVLANHALSDTKNLPDLFRLLELITAQYVYLKAIEDYILQSGISRNSYLVYNQFGKLAHDGTDECFRNCTENPNTSQIQEIRYDAAQEACRVWWRPVRPMPENDQWFETVWQKYADGNIFS